MSTILTYFGNKTISRDPDFFIENYIGRSTSSKLLKAISIPRGSGSAPTQRKVEARPVQVVGNLRLSDAYTTFKESLDSFKKIFQIDESVYLREELEPTFLFGFDKKLPDTPTVTDWTASDDAVNLNLNEDIYQDKGYSVGFDINVSNSANNFATLTYFATSGVDLSSNSETGEFSFSINLPDTNFIEDLEVRIGSDASNYYSITDIENDYMGRAINSKNGVKKIAFKWENMQETGTVSDSDLKYFQVVINYTSNAEDITDCYLDLALWNKINETLNLPVNLQGSVQIGEGATDIDTAGFTIDMLNHTGYAIDIHTNQVASANNITSLTETLKFDLKGSIDQKLNFIFSVVSQQDIVSIDIINVQTNKGIKLNPKNLIDGDLLQVGYSPDKNSLSLKDNYLKNDVPFKISGFSPVFRPGINRVKVVVEPGEDSTEIFPSPALVSDSETSRTIPDSTAFNIYRLAQKFTAPVTGIIQSISFTVRATDSGQGSFGRTYNWMVVSDNAGSPTGTVQDSGNFSLTLNSSYETYTISGLSISATANDEFWISLPAGYRYDSIGVYEILRWATDSTASYSGGEIKTSSDSSSTWTNTSGTWSSLSGDMLISVQMTDIATPDWDFDLSINHNQID